MIAIYDGKIGAGKTYLAVCRILAHLSKGGTVYTNIALRWDGCVKYCANRCGVVLDPDAYIHMDEDQIFDFHRHLRSGDHSLNVLCVVDEAHLWFAARDHAMTAQLRRGLMTFLSQSRKLNVDIVLIAQAAENIDPQFRRLAQEIWRTKDLTRLRVPVLGIGYPWPHTLAVRLDNPSMQILERQLIRRSQAVYDSYDTAALLRPVEFAGAVQSRRVLVAADPSGQSVAAIISRARLWSPSQRLMAIMVFCVIVILRIAYG